MPLATLGSTTSCECCGHIMCAGEVAAQHPTDAHGPLTAHPECARINGWPCESYSEEVQPASPSPALASSPLINSHHFPADPESPPLSGIAFEDGYDLSHVVHGATTATIKTYDDGEQLVELDQNGAKVIIGGDGPEALERILCIATTMVSHLSCLDKDYIKCPESEDKYEEIFGADFSAIANGLHNIQVGDISLMSARSTSDEHCTLHIFTDKLRASFDANPRDLASALIRLAFNMLRYRKSNWSPFTSDSFR